MKTLSELIIDREAHINLLKNEAKRCAQELRLEPFVVDVFLFGSLAKGEANVNSDIDLAVVVSGDKTERVAITTQIIKKLSGITSVSVDG